MFHPTIPTWQFVYKILYNVCSTAFLLLFGTQTPTVVLLKLSHFLSVKALEIFGSSSLEILLKEGLRPSRIFLLDLLHRAKYESIYTVSFNQIVYISSVMIGPTLNFQSSLGYLTAEKNCWLMSTWCTVDMSQLDMDIIHIQSILYCNFKNNNLTSSDSFFSFKPCMITKWSS